MKPPIWLMTAPVTKNEMAMLQAFRRATNHNDPEITPGRQTVVEKIFAWAVASVGAPPA